MPKNSVHGIDSRQVCETPMIATTANCSAARETEKDLVARSQPLGIDIKTYSLVPKLLSEKMATWLGNDFSFENPNVLSDHVSNGKHVQAQICKKYLTGQALLDALKDLEPRLNHHMLNDLSPEERVHVMGWKEDNKKRNRQATTQKPAKKAKTLNADSSPKSAARTGRSSAIRARSIQAAMANDSPSQQQASGFDAQRLLHLLTQPNVDIKNISAADMAQYLEEAASSAQAMVVLRTALSPPQHLHSTNLATSDHVNDDAYGQDEDIDMAEE